MPRELKSPESKRVPVSTSLKRATLDEVEAVAEANGLERARMIAVLIERGLAWTRNQNIPALDIKRPRE